MRLFVCLGLAAVLSTGLFAQSTDPSRTFEIADVHASPRTVNLFMRGPFTRAGRYELRLATMVDLIRTAYGVDADKVVGGPSWLEMDRFDVIAKAPANTKPESFKLMLQSLLADRFKLVVHNDTRPMPAYALTAGKRQGLKKAEGTGETGCNFEVQGMPPQGTPGPVNFAPTIVYTCRNTTMAAFATGMHDMIASQQFLNGNSVVDKTETEGAWDFTFKYTLRGPQPSGETISFFDAIDKQLGLKLEQVRIPMAVIAVDRVNQKPTDNLLGVTKTLQTEVPTEFEVADVKPSDPAVLAELAARGGGRGSPPIQNGRLDVRGITLKNLIMVAWDINSDDLLAGSPKRLDSDRFDIEAKAPGLGPTASNQPIDVDYLRPMVQKLLMDRFKLAVHMEDRIVPAYTLSAAKPKLKSSDPAGRTKWTEGPAPDSKDPRDANPALGRLVTCQNMTMAQFAELLPSIAPGYLRTPVLDATGLDGPWDFTVSFSPAGVLMGGGRGGGGDAGPPAGGTVGASDPSGGLSLFDAVNKQLGLKLEMQKRALPVLVIDHIEQKPTDN